MKMLRLMLFGALVAQAVLLFPVQAQVYSPRRLTQRIAPQLAPSQTPAPPPTAAQPVVRVVQPPVDPEKAKADRDEAQRKAVEFQKKRAEENAQAAQDQPGAKLLKGGDAPLIVECSPVHPGSDASVYSLDLSLRNTSSKAINHVTMRLIYYDSTGAKLKEWTTQRDLDQNLPAKSTIELSQPAYFMPLVTTRRAQVQVEGVRFADGSEWTP